MIVKNENATWLPAIDEPWGDLDGNHDHGWLDLDGQIWTITKVHCFDDLGCTLDTLTIERDGVEKKIYSCDEGDTFTFDVY